MKSLHQLYLLVALIITAQFAASCDQNLPTYSGDEQKKLKATIEDLNRRIYRMPNAQLLEQRALSAKACRDRLRERLENKIAKHPNHAQPLRNLINDLDDADAADQHPNLDNTDNSNR